MLNRLLHTSQIVMPGTKLVLKSTLTITHTVHLSNIYIQVDPTSIHVMSIKPPDDDYLKTERTKIGSDYPTVDPLLSKSFSNAVIRVVSN
jgi:hypothetical protein